MPRGLAYRRQQRSKKMRKARMVTRHVWGWDIELVDRFTPRIADNLKYCSCGICTIHWAAHNSDIADYSAREAVTEAMAALDDDVLVEDVLA